jgi:hypothetical protein
LANASWQAVGVTTNRSLTTPMNGPSGFYRVSQFQPDIQVGQLPNGEQSLPSKQILRAAGQETGGF